MHGLARGSNEMPETKVAGTGILRQSENACNSPTTGLKSDDESHFQENLNRLLGKPH
jgi:hypothetical protein